MPKTLVPEVRNCPIKMTMQNTPIGKKWTLLLVRNMIFGQNRFGEMLRTNNGLSGKVLNERLKEMIECGLVVRIENGEVEYHLTEMGRELNKILYEVSMFGAKYFQPEVFGEEVPHESLVDIFGNGFKLDPVEIEFNKQPEIYLIPGE